MIRRGLSSTEQSVTILAALCTLAFQLAAGGDNHFTALCMTVFASAGLVGLISCAEFSKNLRTLSRSPIFLVLLVLLMADLAVSLRASAAINAQNVWLLVGKNIYGTVDRSATLLEILKLSGLGCTFLLFYSIGSSYSRLVLLISSLAALSILLSFSSIVSFAIAPSTTMGIGQKIMFVDRLTAAFSSPNTAGTFFGSCTVLCIGVILNIHDEFRSGMRNGKWIENFLVLISLPSAALLGSIVALVLSTSRTAAVATAISSILLVITVGILRGWGLKKLFSLALPVSFVGLFVATFFDGGIIFERLTSLSADSVVRGHIYQTHLAAIERRPLVGFGLGTFVDINHKLLLPDQVIYNDLWIVRAMHNVYLQWLEGVGILGSSLFFLAISLVLLTIFRAAINFRKHAIALVTIIFVASVFIIHGLTDFALENFSMSVLLTLYLGAGLGAANAMILTQKPGAKT